MRSTMKKIALVIAIALAGAVPFALAHGGFGGSGGYGGHMMDPGWGGHMMGYGGHMDRWGDREDLGLSREQAEKLEAAREAFYNESRSLREDIYEKSSEIRRELTKENPDRNRLSTL